MKFSWFFSRFHGQVCFPIGSGGSKGDREITDFPSIASVRSQLLHKIPLSMKVFYLSCPCRTHTSCVYLKSMEFGPCCDPNMQGKLVYHFHLIMCDALYGRSSTHNPTLGMCEHFVVELDVCLTKNRIEHCHAILL